MAEIRIIAEGPGIPGGPSLPLPLGATFAQRPWPGGGTTSVLRLHLGADVVEVWPADPERIAELGARLTKLAGELSARPGG